MWLPTPVYESLPYMYVAIGLLLIAGAAYIGIDSRETAIYIGSGAIAVLSGVFVYVRRTVARTKQNRPGDADSAATE